MNFDIKAKTFASRTGKCCVGAMEIPAEETDALVHSIQKYMGEEFDQDISPLKARLLLNYVWDEVAPFAYNAGVKDAQEFTRARNEELPDTVFRDGLNYWRNR